jgi:hypothetical protein
MIVRSMTPAEVVEDARQDVRALTNKAMPLCRKQEREFRLRPKGEDLHENLISWRSPRRNEWFLVLSTTKKGTNIAAMVRYRGNDDRLRALRLNLLNTGPHIHYSAHVLERYCERFDPDLDPIKRLAAFFFANHTPAIQPVKETAPGAYEVMCGMLHGNATGVWHQGANMVELTTFLDHGLLGADQQVLTESLDMHRYFLHFSPGQRAHMLRAIEAVLDRKGDPAQKERVMPLIRQWAGLSAQPAKRV